MTKAYAIGTLKKNAEGKFELVDVSVYGEDPWTLTRQITPDIICVQMSPPISGETYDLAKESVQSLVEGVYQYLPKDLFDWTEKT